MARERRVIFNSDAGFIGHGWGTNPVPEGEWGGYNWTLNWDLHSGAAAPALNVTKIDYNQIAPVTDAFEWTDTSDNPLILFGTGIVGGGPAGVLKVQDGAVSQDTTFAAATVTSCVLYRHDGSDANVEAAYFALGVGKLLRRRIKAGTYSSGTADADKLAVVGSDLWRSKGALVSKCDRDTDPLVSTNWSGTDSDIPVGNPTYPVNRILDFGGSPVILKGDGVFEYNPSTGEFRNRTPHITPHVDNGKGGTADGRGRIYYPTVAGDVLVLSFGSQSQQRPTRMTRIDRNTPFGHITCLTADSEKVFICAVPLGWGVKRLRNV